MRRWARFGQPVGDNVVEELAASSVPKKTRRKMEWARNVVDAWRAQGRINRACGLHCMPEPYMVWLLHRFVLEVCNARVHTILRHFILAVRQFPKRFDGRRYARRPILQFVEAQTFRRRPRGRIEAPWWDGSRYIYSSGCRSDRGRRGAALGKRSQFWDQTSRNSFCRPFSGVANTLSSAAATSSAFFDLDHNQTSWSTLMTSTNAVTSNTARTSSKTAKVVKAKEGQLEMRSGARQSRRAWQMLCQAAAKSTCQDVPTSAPKPLSGEKAQCYTKSPIGHSTLKIFLERCVKVPAGRNLFDPPTSLCGGRPSRDYIRGTSGRAPNFWGHRPPIDSREDLEANILGTWMRIKGPGSDVLQEADTKSCEPPTKKRASLTGSSSPVPLTSTSHLKAGSDPLFGNFSCSRHCKNWEMSWDVTGQGSSSHTTCPHVSWSWSVPLVRTDGQDMPGETTHGQTFRQMVQIMSMTHHDTSSGLGPLICDIPGHCSVLVGGKSIFF